MGSSSVKFGVLYVATSVFLPHGVLKNREPDFAKCNMFLDQHLIQQIRFGGQVYS